MREAKSHSSAAERNCGCGSPKFDLDSTYTAYSLIQTIHVPNVEAVHRPDRSQFVFPPGIADGNSGFATTARCF
jgi:hypothetical protein